MNFFEISLRLEISLIPLWGFSKCLMGDSATLN